MDDLEAGRQIEVAISQYLRDTTGNPYNSIDSWALVVRASSNDGDGDRHYAGLFTPPGQDMFTNAGLRWIFEEGLRQQR